MHADVAREEVNSREFRVDDLADLGDLLFFGNRTCALRRRRQRRIFSLPRNLLEVQ